MGVQASVPALPPVPASPAAPEPPAPGAPPAPTELAPDLEMPDPSPVPPDVPPSGARSVCCAPPHAVTARQSDNVQRGAMRATLATSAPQSRPLARPSRTSRRPSAAHLAQVAP